MYQPGFDFRLAQIRCAEMLEEAEEERAYRATQVASPNAVARKILLVLAGIAPGVVCVAWLIWVR